jgi:NCAIR mutase (PurE)-related protein
MDPIRARALLTSVHRGETSVETALEALAALPFRDLGFANVDHHRALRNGMPEVVLGQGKTPEQVVEIAREILARNQTVLVTRVTDEAAAALAAAVPETKHDPVARIAIVLRAPPPPRGRGPIAVVTAGTADLPVAEEAAVTASVLGNEVVRIYDVGVAGVHRLLARIDVLRAANVLVVVAGMEGALPSVVGGLVARPVIAVPTSVGYGASYGGLAALLGMLNSCAAGVTVVNIDNGFGAAVAASLINRVEP